MLGFILQGVNEKKAARYLGTLEGENRRLREELDVSDELIKAQKIRIEQLEKSLEEFKKAFVDVKTEVSERKTAMHRVYGKFAGVKAMKDQLNIDIRDIVANPTSLDSVFGSDLEYTEKLLRLGREAEYKFLLNELSWREDYLKIHSADSVQNDFWNKEAAPNSPPAEGFFPEPAGYEEGREVVYKPFSE